jgi:predicted esterase
MAKLADALYSGCSIRKDVQVQVLFRARYVHTRTERVSLLGIFFFFLLIPFFSSYSQTPDLRSAFQKGKEAMILGEYAKAIQHFEIWTLAMPRDAQAFVHLASCQARMGKDTAVIFSLEQSLKAGLNEVFLIEQDTILRQFIESKSQLAMNLSSAFWGADNAWTALIQNANEQSDQKRFPIGFAEQKRLARYRILYPKNYDSTKNYRAILLLHGNGLDHIIIAPEAPYVKLKESIQSGAMKLSGRGEDQFFPDSLQEDVINQTAEWYVSTLNHVKKTLPISNDPQIVMGFSQGGFFASVLMSRYPESFSSAITLCGSMFPEGKIEENLSKVKALNRDMLIVHGRQDTIVPFSVAESFSKQLSNAKIGLNHIKSNHFFCARTIRWQTLKLQSSKAIHYSTMRVRILSRLMFD